jgi:hypothetical protein
MGTFAEAKILFATPSTLDSIYKLWFLNWTKVVKPPNTTTTFDSTMPLSTNRNKSVARALDEGADYLMFIDHDQILRPDTVVHLWKYNLPVVGGLYFERGYPHLPLIYNFSQEGKTIRVQHDYPKGLIKCDVLGMGCSLWRTDVFRQFPAPWFTYERENGGGEWGTEDIAVFTKLKQLNIPVHVDTEHTVGHVGMHEFTEADWLREKPGYIAKCLAELQRATEAAKPYQEIRLEPEEPEERPEEPQAS